METTIQLWNEVKKNSISRRYMVEIKIRNNSKSYFYKNTNKKVILQFLQFLEQHEGPIYWRWNGETVWHLGAPEKSPGIFKKIFHYLWD